MPRLPPRTPPPPEPFRMVFGDAAGLSAKDFYVLGYCQEFDDEEIRDRNPDHEHFTHLLRFAGGQRSIVARLPERLEFLWAAPSGVVLGVGRPRGVLEIRGSQVQQQTINQVPGTFATIWGTDDAHVYACGNYQSFLFYRQRGIWRDLPLPPQTPGLWSVRGTSETDVYAVGQKGVILHFDGHVVRRLDSPTTRWLTSVARLDDQMVCIGGYDGTLLVGNVHGWRRVDIGTDADLLSIVSYRGGVSYLTPDGLWWFDAAQGVPVRLASQGGRWLSAIGADSLLISKNQQSWLFDGTQLHPLDTTL